MDILFKNWENILATLGAISLFLHALELGCASAGWTKYQGIFSQLVKFIQGFIGTILNQGGNNVTKTDSTGNSSSDSVVK